MCVESDMEMRIKVALSKVFSTLAKDYKILKLIFIITASFLIYNVFFDFLIVKPTYRSDGKRNIGLEDFPEITICPKEPINLSAANINGYHDFETYYISRDIMMVMIRLHLAGLATSLKIFIPYPVNY